MWPSIGSQSVTVVERQLVTKYIFSGSQLEIYFSFPSFLCLNLILEIVHKNDPNFPYGLRNNLACVRKPRLHASRSLILKASCSLAQADNQPRLSRLLLTTNRTKKSLRTRIREQRGKKIISQKRQRSDRHHYLTTLLVFVREKGKLKCVVISPVKNRNESEVS